MDRLGGNFDFAGERGGVGIFAGLKRLMDAQHPLQRRTRMESPRCRHSRRRFGLTLRFHFFLGAPECRAMDPTGRTPSTRHTTPDAVPSVDRASRKNIPWPRRKTPLDFGRHTCPGPSPDRKSTRGEVVEILRSELWPTFGSGGAFATRLTRSGAERRQ